MEKEIIKKNKRLFFAIIISISLAFSSPSYAFFGSMMDVMKEMIKGGTTVATEIITTGGDVAGDSLKLMAKLSDDIGLMADRILKMSDKIGDMADRIVSTEELLADLVEKLSGINAHSSYSSTTSNKNANKSSIVVLAVLDKNATKDTGPELDALERPDSFLLYVSETAMFREGQTIISHVTSLDEYNDAWKRSINAIEGDKKQESFSVSIAIKEISNTNSISSLSNSISITIH